MKHTCTCVSMYIYNVKARLEHNYVLGTVKHLKWIII